MSVWGQQILTAVFAGQSSYIFADYKKKKKDKK